jgi:hypothetical protein
MGLTAVFLSKVSHLIGEYYCKVLCFLGLIAGFSSKVLQLGAHRKVLHYCKILKFRLITGFYSKLKQLGLIAGLCCKFLQLGLGRVLKQSFKFGSKVLQ